MHNNKKSITVVMLNIKPVKYVKYLTKPLYLNNYYVMLYSLLISAILDEMYS